MCATHGSMFLRGVAQCSMVNRTRSFGCLIFIAAFVLTGNGCSEHTRNRTQLSNEVIDAAIQQGVEYLIHVCQPDGRFIYQVDSVHGTISGRYNIVRHSGTIYSLVMADDLHSSLEIVDTIKRAVAYLKANYVSSDRFAHNDSLSAIWSSAIWKNKMPRALLGATGLGLVALVNAARIEPGMISDDDLQALGRFLLFLQKSDGSFHTAYLPLTDKKFDDSPSLYFPGEAALGLLCLYEHDHSIEWLNGAEKALLYLANSCKNVADIPADHWALIATEKILTLPGQPIGDAGRELLLRHGILICKAILKEQLNGPSDDSRDDGFDWSGRTTPTATRVEGLLAFLTVLPSKQTQLRSEMVTSVNRAMHFLLNAQIHTGRFAGGIPRALKSAAAPLHQDHEVDDPRADEIRIDYVQHYLCAMIRYRQQLGELSKLRK
jgi:hypothetical protein